MIDRTASSAFERVGTAGRTGSAGRIGRIGRIVAFAAAAVALMPASAEAQIFEKVKEAAEKSAEREVVRQVDEATRNAVRCAFNDQRCVERAEERGETVVYTDADGNELRDEDGNLITDPDEAAAAAGADEATDAGAVPGEGVWVNYDFVPGARVLFVSDFSDDRVGDFPRELEFISGNMEVAEWNGRRFLRASSDAEFAVPLTELLPERFTLEVEMSSPRHIWSQEVYMAEPREGHANVVLGTNRPGIDANSMGGGESRMRVERGEEGVLFTGRVMADGNYVKVYHDEFRVANVPNAELGRSDRITFRLRGSPEYVTYVTDIRVMAGGRDLYDALASEGRVATHGILFDTGSDRIRPESTPTLEEIARLLEEHPDLRLKIEGHTDDTGDAEFNRTLSERRAVAVKAYLVDRRDIEARRLETEGFGPSQPAADNATPEGRQQNRRVELVRLD